MSLLNPGDHRPGPKTKEFTGAGTNFELKNILCRIGHRKADIYKMRLLPQRVYLRRRYVEKKTSG